MTLNNDAPKKSGRPKKVVGISNEMQSFVKSSFDTMESLTSNIKIQRDTDKKPVVKSEKIKVTLKEGMQKQPEIEEDPFAILSKETEYIKFFNKPVAESTEKYIPVKSHINQEFKADIAREEKQIIPEESFKITFPKKKIKAFFKKLIYLLLAMGTISAMYSGYIFAYNKYFSSKSPLETLNNIAVIPSEEMPKAYLITKDAELLKNPIFAGAMEGDTVFVFEKSKKVYIFRQSSNKVVSILPLQ